MKLRRGLRQAHERVLLCIILAIGATMRLFGLTFQSLWLDELWSHRAASHETVRDVVMLGAAQDAHPPGYPLLIHFWQRLCGESEMLLRLPSAICGIATILVIYRLGLRLYSRRVGLIAAALSAVHGHAIFYSQEARPYAALLLGSSMLALMGSEIAARHARGARTYLWFAAFVVVGILTSYLHYFGVLFLALLGIFLFALSLAKRFPMAQLLGAYGLIALAYLPWVSFLLEQVHGRDGWMREPSARAVWLTFHDLSARQLPLWVVLFALAALAFLLRARAQIEGESRLKSRKELSMVCVLAAWVLLPFAAALLITYAVVPVYSIRNLIITLPAVLLLGAYAIDLIERVFLRGRPLIAIAGCAFLAFDLVVVRDYYRTPTKEPIRAVLEEIANASASHPSVIITQPSWYGGFVDEYFALLGSELRVTRGGELPAKLAAEGRDVWVIARRVSLRAPEGLIEVSRKKLRGRRIDLQRGHGLTLGRFRAPKTAQAKAQQALSTHAEPP